MENLLLKEFSAEKGKMKFKAEILTTKQKTPKRCYAFIQCFFPETKFNHIKLPGRSTMIGGQKMELPFSGRKGKKFSPGLAHRNNDRNLN